jgi:hypothetical protein
MSKVWTVQFNHRRLRDLSSARQMTFAVGEHQNVRFSNRPFEVKHFQTIHHCSVDVAHGLVLLSESAPRPLYLAFLVKKFKQGSPSFFFVSFFV